MVEGSAALVVFVRSARRHRRVHAGGRAARPRRSCRAAAAPAWPGCATPIGDALVVVTAKMTPDPRGSARGPSRLGRARRLLNLDLSNALAPTGFTYAPDPVVAAGQLDRRQREHERRRPALPRLRRDRRAHVLGARRRAAGRDRRAPGRSEGPAARRLRPARSRRRLGRDARHRGARRACGSRRSRPPSARCCWTSRDVDDCAATVSAIIARGVVPAALEMMDRGIVRAVESFAHAGYPTDAAAVLLVEVDGLAAGVEAQTPRGGGRGAREHGVGTIRVAADDDGARPAVEGPEVGVRRDRADRAATTTCTIASCRARSWPRCSAGVYAIAQAPRPDRHERLPRRRRQPPPAVLVRPARARNARARAVRRADELVRLCVDAGGVAQRRARHRPGEARLHAARVHRRGSERAGVRPSGLRPRRADEPAQGAARRRAVRRLRGGRARRADGPRRFRRARGSDPPALEARRRRRAADARAPRRRALLDRRRTARTSTRATRVEVDAELWTTVLDDRRRVRPGRDALRGRGRDAHPRPPDRCSAEGGQEWPVDAPGDATVGGVIAAGAATVRQLRVGTMRDTVVEMEVVTRRRASRARAGARTVKNVTGYDVHRLLDRLARHPRRDRAGRAEGAAAAARPTPDAGERRRRPGARPPGARDRAVAGRRARRARTGCVVRLEGWPEEVEEQTTAARSMASMSVGDRHFVPEPPASRRRRSSPKRARRAVTPWCLARPGPIATARASASASRGSRLEDETRSRRSVRARPSSAGIAPVVKGPGGLGDRSGPGCRRSSGGSEPRSIPRASWRPAGIVVDSEATTSSDAG